jgi:hypothetical protein
MLKGNAMAIKADKQNGYVIEDRDTTVRVHEDILGSESYSEVAPCSLTRSSIVDGYCKLCKRVANHEKIVNLLSTLTRTLGGDMAVKLQLTCKKPQTVWKGEPQEPSLWPKVGI